MKKHFRIITALLFIVSTGLAQWSLKLTSNVYLRTWKLETKASKEEKEVDGATVTLFQNGKQISQTTSSNGGEFTIMVPQEGEFYLTVSYPGCNTKRMSINTQNVPANIAKDNFKPSFKISGGFIMVKPYPGINYSELNQDLIRVEYSPGKKAFDDTEEGTDRGLGIVSKIYSAEDDLFNRFCSTNKAGDVALAKPDCPLAKTLYEKAIAMIPGEQYPVVQLAKVGLCLKDKELAEKKAAEDAAAKAAANNASKEDADKKAIADAIAKANEQKAKQIKEEEEKLAKASKEKAAKEDAENAKIVKQKAAEEKAVAKQTPTQTATAQQTPKEKKGDIKIKQKSPEQIEKEAEEAKKREGKYKSQQEDKDAMAKDAAEAKAKYEEKQKAAREKEQKQKEGLAKSKAEDEAAMKDKEAKRAAKQKEHEEKQKEGLAKSKAEDEAAMKADAEKKAKKQAEREAEEKEKKRLAYETKSKEDDGGQDKGNSDNKIPQVIGAAEKYRERIKAADELFKRKRYDEAKDIYNEALMYKEKDPYALNKLAEIEKLKVPK